jgi:hypothetical protein
MKCLTSTWKENHSALQDSKLESTYAFTQILPVVIQGPINL